MTDYTSSHLNWIKNGDWSCGASATDRDNDVTNLSGGFFGRIFISDCSAWGLADNAEVLIDFAIIDFNHHTVGTKWQTSTNFAEMVDFGNHLVERIKGAVLH